MNATKLQTSASPGLNVCCYPLILGSVNIRCSEMGGRYWLPYGDVGSFVSGSDWFGREIWDLDQRHATGPASGFFKGHTCIPDVCCCSWCWGVGYICRTRNAHGRRSRVRFIPYPWFPITSRLIEPCEVDGGGKDWGDSGFPPFHVA